MKIKFYLAVTFLVVNISYSQQTEKKNILGFWKITKASFQGNTESDVYSSEYDYQKKELSISMWGWTKKYGTGIDDDKTYNDYISKKFKQYYYIFYSDKTYAYYSDESSNMGTYKIYKDSEKFHLTLIFSKSIDFSFIINPNDSAELTLERESTYIESELEIDGIETLKLVKLNEMEIETLKQKESFINFQNEIKTPKK